MHTLLKVKYPNLPMSISVLEMFSIGIGPSSSHTVGPMRAARQFASVIASLPFFYMRVDLYGSLALTGVGHGTDKAIILGLLGYAPDEIDPEIIEGLLKKIRDEKKLSVFSTKSIEFNESKDIVFHKDKFLPYHPNGMRFAILDEEKNELLYHTYYSVGGGFVVDHNQAMRGEVVKETKEVPYPFHTGEELLGHCSKLQLSVPDLIRLNEPGIDQQLLPIWKAMETCIARGVQTEGVLPGGLGVERRAPLLYRSLQASHTADPARILDWVSLWALAVNEENAAGGRVVTAPTNGAAGVVPAVLKYYQEMVVGAHEKGIIDFLLTAGAMGILFKLGASISAAEMGCMGEVGVACAMAAAGLTAALGGTPIQVENAAEIGMEHHLGLTCDPVKGLVQVPCIERNTMGAIQAINASRLALSSPSRGIITLDHVIATMRETGRNMQSIYKETSLGGLAANVPEC